MNKLIAALQILLKYQTKENINYTQCNYNDFIVKIDNINDVTNEDFIKLFELGFFAGIHGDVLDNDIDEFEYHMGIIENRPLLISDIIYLKAHCSNAFHKYN